jgi:hypothetical protein
VRLVRPLLAPLLVSISLVGIRASVTITRPPVRECTKRSSGGKRGPPAPPAYAGCMSGTTPEPPVPGGGLVFDDPLGQQTSDDVDLGWGDESRGDRGDLARFLDEKPPHHL